MPELLVCRKDYLSDLYWWKPQGHFYEYFVDILLSIRSNHKFFSYIDSNNLSKLFKVKLPKFYNKNKFIIQIGIKNDVKALKLIGYFCFYNNLPNNFNDIDNFQEKYGLNVEKIKHFLATSFYTNTLLNTTLIRERKISVHDTWKFFIAHNNSTQQQERFRSESPSLKSVKDDERISSFYFKERFIFTI
ncbi:hypothetical protein BpHYR1_047875 [Brachionus plicatilis]|uniref:Uncharacterized protein n=1 Tax=Brachionus plicatilis TaxID=10195 RepID=A0A3M7T8N7_BRAPC|nr:hypothetical protein BpHYR1_047875 [Brachionus plicatilis]